MPKKSTFSSWRVTLYAEHCRRLYDYLNDMGPENRALACAKERGVMLHGMVTDNLVEQVFSFIKPARSLSAYFFIQEVTLKAILLYLDEKASSVNYKHILTPPARVKFEESTRLYTSKRYNLTWTNVTHTLGNVQSISNGSLKSSVHRVNVTKRHCTCGVWTQFGIPCAHALRVLRALGEFKTEKLQTFYTNYFKPIAL